MPDPERKYVRVYYNDLIRDYPEVWSDNDQLATWLRLLATADPMWPTPPELPRTVRSRPLAALVSASLVEIITTHRFRMKGMDAERSRRQDAARNAAASRWQSKSTAETMPTKDEQSKAEQSNDPPASNDPWDDPEHEVRVWLANHGCEVRPGSGWDKQLVVAVGAHGVNAMVGMMDRLARGGYRNGDIKGFLFGAIDALDKQKRPDLGEIAQEDRAEQSRQHQQREVERTQEYLRSLREVPSDAR
jgi:hypothetical protein